MSKQNKRGMNPNYLKIINFKIKKIQAYALKHPCGFPHSTDGKELYFDEIQSLRKRKENYISNLNLTK